MSEVRSEVVSLLAAEEVAGSVRASDRLRAFYELTKPNLSALVMITGVLGFCLGSAAIDWVRFCHLVLGLWCTAGGAGALNMVIERDLDALMRRTAVRPIPSGRVSVRAATIFAVALFAFGFVDLALFTTWTTALLSLATLVLYVLVYTPLKAKGPIAIWIGAVPGAIPPVMGWAAVDGSIAPAAAVLFGLLFLWQFPHFLALAWMYRDDYRRAGFDFLPAGADRERRTARAMLFAAALLIPVTLALGPLGSAGAIYSAGALAAGIWFTARTARMLRSPSEARGVFLSSIVYLPILLALIGIDRLVS